MAWTKEQLEAINLEGNNILVSAGAGSGKTAVLTERVKRKLLDGISIENLLVLTFTNAAASEMKERIRKVIIETPELQEELNKLDSSYISTFDSFSLAVIKKYHTRLNITSQVEVADEVLVSIKKEELLDEIFDEYYLSPKSSFLNLISDFCFKDDKELKNYILKIYKKLELKYDKLDYLNNYSYNLDLYVEDYLALIHEKQQVIKNLIINLSNYVENDFIIKLEDNINKLINSEEYSEIIKHLDDKVPPARKFSDEAKVIKKSIDEEVKGLKELCSYESILSMKEEILSTEDNTNIIIEILKEFDRRLEEYKYTNQIFTFTDIARLAIKVVKENNDIREELSNSFQEILVDEYQDTSDLQELFISLIAHNNVYMVGDIKQSIYRFRNANPKIFKDKYDSFDGNKGIKIDLVKNFRSRQEVLENINLLFNRIMNNDIGGADYKTSHRLVFGNNSYIEEGNTNQDYNFNIITYDKEKLGRITSSEEEAYIIGKDILDKINSGYLIFDKDEKKLRKAEYKDFVILLDKSKDFDLYKKIFEYLQIPLSILKEESLSRDDDLLVIRNLLRFLICIKEKRYDLEFKYCYVSLSRSFLFKTSDEEIYDTYINDKIIDTNLYKKCLELVDNIDLMTPSSYLMYILEELDYDNKILTTNNIKNLRIRLEYLYNFTKNFENMGNTIYDFSKYLTDIYENDYDIKFNINSGTSNSCKIMTIHKSKGLEYPICYYAGLASKFNNDEMTDRIIFDNKYGFILPKVDKCYKDTIIKTLVKRNNKREDISERIRLLYVALTRAKEKMIIVIPKQEEQIEEELIPNHIKEKYYSFLTILKSIYSSLLPYIKETNVIANKDYQNNIKSNRDSLTTNNKLEVEEISIDTNYLEDKHYSKESIKLIDKDEYNKLNIGTLVHKILEEIDFNNYDLSNYNIDDNIKDKINMFIKSDLMKDKLNLNMYKEYEFITEEDNTISHGIIDLLIEDEIMYIIDYKLKGIDDSNYDKQLNGYRKYIKDKTNKETKCYLYSILDGVFREVKED